MSTVRREAPRQTDPWGLTCNRIHEWHHQCLQDLAAERHAVGCRCVNLGQNDEMGFYFPNACTEIVRCALEMRSYETEVEDASDKQPECL